MQRADSQNREHHLHQRQDALAGLDLSSAAGGLTAFVAGVARKYADKHITINNLLPGSFDTQRLRGASLPPPSKPENRKPPWRRRPWRRFLPSDSALPRN